MVATIVPYIARSRRASRSGLERRLAPVSTILSLSQAEISHIILSLFPRPRRSRDAQQHPLARAILFRNFLLFRLGLGLIWVDLQEHVEERYHRRIWSGFSHGGSTGRASVWVLARCPNGLEGKPCFQTRATESM